MDNETVPRSPTEEELQELKNWVASFSDEEAAELTVLGAYVTVWDHYTTDSPGYSGKLMVVVYGGSPTFYDAFTWRGGKLTGEAREWDQNKP